MKMKPEHFEVLSEEIGSVLSLMPTLDQYLERGLSPMRWRWDLLWRTGLDVTSWYNYLNDTHIDTALRRITKT